MDIPPEEHFHFRDGTSVSDLEGLKEKIENIGYEEFYSHVNDEKNDFANWIEGVLQDGLLANRLRAVTSIVETVELLNETLYPDDTVKAEEAMKKAGSEDFQERIEQELFTDEPAPTEAPAPDDVPSPDMDSEELPEHEPEEVSLPKEEEVTPERIPNAPVTSAAPAHVPVTERVDRPVSHEEHMRFVVKQFIYGFLLGVIIGYILANVLGQFI